MSNKKNDFKNELIVTMASVISKVIYKVTHKETGQVYIGTTVDLSKRRRDHLQKAKTGTGHKFQEAIATYGPESFEWEQIDTASTSSEAAVKERQYIIQYKSKEAGFNSDCGGGIKKNIYQYEMVSGDLLNTYKDLQSAGNAVGVDKKTVSKACLGETKTCAGYYWSYTPYGNFIHKEDKRLKKVLQFNVEGKFLQAFKSVAEASKITGVNKSSIAKCCRHKRKESGGFIWNYTL